MKIARIATVPFFLYNHLREQIKTLVVAGHEVVLISSAGEEAAWLHQIAGVRFREVDIPRKISPLRDVRALWQLYRIFREERFDIVHSATPKAGLLCAAAAWFARVPIRLHSFTGQAWVELHGVSRRVARAGDWLTAHLNTLCYADSNSQRDFLVEEGIGEADRIRVLGSGSLAGVDLERFNLPKWSSHRERMLRELGAPEGSKVITFIGRLTRDKGVSELLDAFKKIAKQGGPYMLLLIGPEDAADGSLRSSVHSERDGQIRYLGYSNQPECYLALTDVFCLPSYREGFGNVVIEAAAMGVPTIGSDIVGMRDSIVNGETGILVPAKNSLALAGALEKLLADGDLRRAMGNKAMRRAVAEFGARRVNALVLEEYQRLSRARR